LKKRIQLETKQLFVEITTLYTILFHFLPFTADQKDEIATYIAEKRIHIIQHAIRHGRIPEKFLDGLGLRSGDVGDDDDKGESTGGTGHEERADWARCWLGEGPRAFGALVAKSLGIHKYNDPEGEERDGCLGSRYVLFSSSSSFVSYILTRPCSGNINIVAPLIVQNTFNANGENDTLE
jgi:hypothetical protein